MSSPESSARSARASLTDTVAEVAAQIESILGSAEAVAAQIQEEAEAKAEAYLTERRAEADRLADSQRAELESRVAPLLERAQRLQGEADALAREVESTLHTVTSRRLHQVQHPSGLATSPPPAPPSPEQPSPQEPQAAPTFAGAGVTGGEDAQPAENVRREALLRATQMAVAQSGRTEIELALQREFGISDPVPFVDEILGGPQA